MTRLAFVVAVAAFYGYVIGYLANDTSTSAYHMTAVAVEAEAYLHVGQIVHYRKHEWGLVGSVLGTVVALLVYGTVVLFKRTRVEDRQARVTACARLVWP